MPRPREYENAAARQAAYRARQRTAEPPLQGYLAALARTLHGELAAAVAAGCSPVPPGLITARADDTLRNLIRHLQQLREAGAAPAQTGGGPMGAKKEGGSMNQR